VIHEQATDARCRRAHSLGAHPSASTNWLPMALAAAAMAAATLLVFDAPCWYPMGADSGTSQLDSPQPQSPEVLESVESCGLAVMQCKRVGETERPLIVSESYHRPAISDQTISEQSCRELMPGARITACHVQELTNTHTHTHTHTHARTHTHTHVRTHASYQEQERQCRRWRLPGI